MANSGINKGIHSSGSSEYAGDYQVTDEALKNYAVDRNKFGTTDIQLPDGSSFNVKDYQYSLDNGNMGMYFIPVNEYGIFTDVNGKEVWGSQLADAFIRDKLRILPADIIYTFVYYIHPELNKNTIQGFAQTEKVEMGITHLGAYYGQGVTSNSPPLYHNRSWGVAGTTFGYPANVMIISMENVDQSMLNKNFQLTDKFLNYGVRFPKDYKNSAFRMIDINTCLMFYRDWIREENYLKTDSSWFTYCAAHKTLVTTVALNLPHNRNSFKEVYGETEGSDFYDLFCKNYFALVGEEFTSDDETEFEPLWKKEGLLPTQIKPFTVDEYYAFETARREKKLDSFKGFRPLKPNQATAWAPQLAADVILNFVEAYADFLHAGAIVSCSTIMGYMQQVTERMGISAEEYLQTAMPILETIMQAHAMLYAPQDPNPVYEKSHFYLQSFEALYIGYGGKKENIPAALSNFPVFEKYEGKLQEFITLLQTDQLFPEFLAWWSLWRVRQNWLEIISKSSVQPEEANEWLWQELKSGLDTARNIVATGEDKIQFNIPPSTVHMIELGMFSKNPRIELKTICTVMDHMELEPKR